MAMLFGGSVARGGDGRGGLRCWYRGVIACALACWVLGAGGSSGIAFGGDGDDGDDADVIPSPLLREYARENARGFEGIEGDVEGVELWRDPVGGGRGDGFGRRVLGRLSGGELWGWGLAGSGFRALSDEDGGEWLSSYPARTRDAVLDALAGELLSSGVSSLSGEDSFIKGLDVGYQSPLGSRDGSFSVEAVFGLWEGSDALVFGQGGYIVQERESGWEPGANAGLGYRFLANDILLGANVFFDYLNDDEHGAFRRYSLGAEARGRYWDVSANWYRRLSDVNRTVIDGENYLVYTASGWDAEGAVRLPGWEWLELAVRRYEWEREIGGDIRGFNYRLTARLIQALSLEAEYDYPEGGGDDWSVHLRFSHSWEAGDGFASAFSRAGKSSGLVSDAWSRRYERVRRRYEQRIIEERVPASSAATDVIALGAGGNEVVEGGSPLMITLSVSGSAGSAGDEYERVFYMKPESGDAVLSPESGVGGDYMVLNSEGESLESSEGVMAVRMSAGVLFVGVMVSALIDGVLDDGEVVTLSLVKAADSDSDSGAIAEGDYAIDRDYGSFAVVIRNAPYLGFEGDSASGSEGEEIRARVIGWDGALWRDNLRINYELIAATADESDYASAGCASGECFSAGSGEAWIDVLLTADEEAEANEDFIVRLLPGEGYESDANRSEIRVRIAAPLSGARILGDVNSAVWSQADSLRGRVVLDAAANGGEGIIVELSAPLELAAFGDDFRLNLVGDEFACGTLAESNGSLRRVCEVSAEAGDEEIPFFVSADGPVGGYALMVRLIEAEGYAAELSSYAVSVNRAAMALIPTPNSPLMAGGSLELRALSNDLSGVSAGLFNLTLSVSGGNAGDWEMATGGNALSGCRPPDGICLSPYQAGTGGLSAFEFRALRSPVGGAVVTVSLAAGEMGAYSGSSATVTLASAAGVGIANADYSVAEGANQEVRLLIDSPLPPGLIVTIRVESADAIKGDSVDSHRLGSDYQLLDGGGNALNCIADGAAFLCDAEIGADGRSAVFEAAAHLDGQTESNERLRLSVVDGDAYIASGGESEIIIANTVFSLAFHLAPTAGDEGDSLRFVLRAEGVTLTGGLAVNINTALAALNPQAIRGEDYDLAIPNCASSGVCQVIADDSASEIVFDVALLPDALSDSPEHFRLLIESGDGYSPSALAGSADVRIGGDSPRFGFSQDFAEEYWGREIEAVVEFIPPLSSSYNLRIGISGGDADDYESVPASVCANDACAISLPSGSAAATLTLMLKAGEAGRRLNLSLIGEPLNYLAFRRETAIAINTPALSFAAAGASANEGDSLRPSIRRNIAVGETFRFHLLPDADLSNDDYSLSGDDIECGEDICTATWPADALDLAITLSASADFIAEGIERLTLSLSADDGYALGGNSIYIASFNDIRPQASFDKAAVNLTEAGAAVRAEIRLTHIPSQDIAVFFAVAESGASADDYQLLDESNAPLPCVNGICQFRSLTIPANERAAAFLIHAPLDDDEEGEESVVLSLLAGEQPNAVFGLGSPDRLAVVIADSGLFGYRLSADDVHWNEEADVVVEFDPALGAGADIELRASHRLEGQSDLIGGFAASAIPTPLAVGGVVDFACDDISGCSGVIPVGRTSATLRFISGAVYGGGGLRFNLNAANLPQRRLGSNQFDLAIGSSEVRLVGGSANAVEGETTAADIGISPPVSGVSVPLLLQGTNAADHRLRLGGNDLICGALPNGVDALDGRDCGYALSLPASDSNSAVQFTAVSDGVYEGAEAISFRLSPIAADGFGVADDSGEFILTISDPAVVFEFDEASAKFVREGQAITLTATADQSLAIPLIVSITVAAVNAESADWRIEGCADNADCTIILPPGDNAEVVLTLTAVVDADDDDEIIDVRVVDREGVIDGDTIQVTLREDRRMGFGSDVSVPLGQEAAIAINFNPPLPRDANAFIVHLGNDHAGRLNAVAVSQGGVSCANADSDARRCTITPSDISDDGAGTAISRLILRLTAEHPSASYSITASLASASLPEGYLISEAAAEAEVAITPLKAAIKTNDANAEIGRDAALTVSLDFASPAEFNVSLGISGGEGGQYQLLDSTGGILSGCDAPNGVCALPIAADTDAAVIALRVLTPGEADINIAVINYSLGTNAPYTVQGGAAAVGILSALAAGIAGTDADEGQTAEIKITIPRATPSALPVRVKVSGDAVKGTRESAYADGSDYQLFANGAPLNCPVDPAPDSAALLCDVIIAANAKAATITLTAHLDGQAEDPEPLAFEILAHANAPAYAPSTDANADINIVNTEFALVFALAPSGGLEGERLIFEMRAEGVTLTGGLTVNINAAGTDSGLQATRGVDYQIIDCASSGVCQVIAGDSASAIAVTVTLLSDGEDESPEFFRLSLADGEGYTPSPPDFIDVEIADIPRFGFTQSGADQFWGYEGEAVIDFAPPLVSPVRIAASFPAGALGGKLTGGGDFVCDGVQNQCVADIAASESDPVSQAALRLTGHKAGSGEAFDIVLSGDVSDYTIAGGGGAAGDRFRFAVNPLNAAIAADGQTAAEGAAAEYHLEVSPPPAESLNVAVRARISQTAINAELRDFEMKDGDGAALVCVAAADGESTLCAAPVSASASPDLTATVTVDLTVAISFDADYEPNLEEIIISAEGGEGYAPSASQFIARMQNAPFDLSFANDAYYAAEGARIELNAAVQFAQILDDSFPLSLNIIPHASANAAYGEDYTIAGCGADAIAACELTIAGADRIAEIAVDIIDDGLVEANEFIIVELSAAKVPPPYNLGQTIRATIEISDAAAVGFTGDINPIWGTSGDLIIDFALPLTASAELIMDITGGEYPADFTSSALSCEGAVCTIEANGSSSAPLRRMILDIAPTKAAARKRLQFTLRQAPAGYTLGQQTAKANVGVPVIGWSPAGGSIAEGAFHAVRLVAAPSVDDSFNVNLIRTGDADDGDWSSSNLQTGDAADAFILSVPADSGGADMHIAAAIDGRGEADERLTLTIAPAHFYDIDSAANPYQLTIANQPVAAHFQSAQAAVAEAGGVNIPLVLDPAAQSNLSLRLQLSGDAIYGSDYRLFIDGAEGVREADTDIYAFTMPPGNPPLRLEALLDDQDEDGETANIQILPNAHISPANPSQLAVVIADSGLFGYRLSAADVHWNEGADVVVEFDPVLAAGADIELRASHRLEGQSDLIGGFAASAIPTPLAVGGVVDFVCDDISGCSGVIPVGRTSATLRFISGAVYGGGGLRFNLNAANLPQRRLGSNQFDLAIGSSEVRLVGGSANAVEGETTAADIGISPSVSGVSVPLLLQGTNAADHRLRLGGNDLICGALPGGVDALDGRDCGYALSLPASDSVQFTAVSDGIYEGAEAISFRLSPIAADGFGVADDSGEFILTISDPAVVFEFDEASAKFVREGQAITLTATADQSLAIPLIVSITVDAVDAESADWRIEGCADNADCTIILPPGDNAEVVLTLTAVVDADDDDEIIDVSVANQEGVIVGDSIRVTLREDRRMGFGSDVSVPLGQEAAIALDFNPPLPRDANAFIVHLGNDHAGRLNAVAVSQGGVSCANADSNARQCTITPSAVSDDDAVLADAAISRLMLRLAAEHPSASYSITASLALASLPEGYLISEAAAEAEVSITPLKAAIKTNDANAEIGRDAALTVSLDFASPAEFNVSLGISGGEGGQYQLLDSTGGILSGCDAPNGVCALPIAADTDAAVIALRVLTPGEADINIAVINYSLGTNAPYTVQGGAAAVGVLSALAAGIAGTDAGEGQTAEIKITIPRATPSVLPVRMKVSGDAVKGTRESAYANGSDYQLFADGAPLNCPKDPAPDSAALLCDVMIAANAKAATITLTAHLDGQAEDTESLAFEILAHANAPAYAPSTETNADINVAINNTEFAFGFDDASARTSSENRLLELVMSPVGVTLIGGLAVNINTENTGSGLQATRGVDYQIIGCDAAACEFIIGDSDDNLILKVTLLLDATDESAPEFFRLRIADGEGYAPSPPDFIDVEIADIPRFGFTQSGADQFWGYEGEAVIDFAPPLVSPVRIAASFPAGALGGKLTGGGDFVCDGVQNQCVADIAASESDPVSQAALRLTGHKAGSGEAFDIVLSGDVSDYTIAGGGGAAGDRFRFAVNPLNAAIAADGQTAAEGAAAEYHLEVSPPPAESLNVAVRARISQTAINAELRDFEMKDGDGAALVCVAAADGESTLCAAPVSASASPDLTATVTVDLTVAISFDADYEPNLEEIIISAEGGEGYAPSASQFIARMQNAPFDLSFANDAYYAAEGARIELNAAVQFAQILDDSFPLSLNIIPHASANAAYGEDYTIAGCGADAIAACELTIAGADRIAEIAVDIIDDGLVEANEFIIVELSAAKVPPPYNLGQTIRATIEISDAAAVGFTGDINPIWGTSGDLIIDFALPLTASAELIMDITGGEYPADFTSSALSCEGAVCTIEANGSSSAPLRRMILDIAPTKAAARKRLQFTLRQAPAGYTLGQQTAKANVGVPVIGWSPAGGSIAEGAFHAVRLVAAPSVDDSFNVNLIRTGDADDGDWSSSNLQTGDAADAFILSVPADSGGADMHIAAAIDGRGEADERLTLTIAPAHFYDIDSAANPYQLTIANQPVAAHFQSAQAAVAEAGGVNIPLVLDPAAQSNLSLRLQLSGDAIYGSDYRLFIDGAEGVREADTDIYAFTMPPGNPPLRLEALLDDQDEDGETANIQILPNAHISPANPSQLAVVIADSGLFGYRLSAADVHWNEGADVVVEFDPVLAAGADIELRASHRLEGQSDLIGGFAASAIPTPLAVGGVVDFVCDDISGCSGVIPVGRTSATLRFISGAVYGGGGLRFNLNAANLPQRRLGSNQFDLAIGSSEVRLVGGSANAVEGETTAADIGISPSVSGVSVPLLLQGTNAADHRLRLGGNDLICGALPGGVDALDGRDCGYALSLPASDSVQFTAVSDGIYEGAEAISFRLSPIAADGFGVADDSGEFILTISDPAVVFEFDEASAKFVREGQAITLTATADQSLAIPLIVSITVDAVDAESADWRIEGCADNADCTIILPPGDNAEVVLTLTAVVDADDDDEIIDVSVANQEGVIVGDSIRVTLREDRRMGFGSDVSVPLGQEAAIALDFNPPLPRDANAFIVHLGNDHAGRLNAVAVSQGGVSCANADSNARQCTITPSAVSDDDAVLADAAISRLMLRLAAEHPSASYSITASLALASLPEGYLISEAAAEAEVSITPLKAAIKTNDANAEIGRDAALTVSLDFASPAEFNVSLGISGGEGGQYQLLDSTGGILSGCDAPNGVCALPIAADTDAAVIALRVLTPGEAEINIAVINYSLGTNAPYTVQGGAAAVGVLSALAAGIAGTDADEGQTAEIKITIPRATPSVLPVRMKVSGDAVKGTRESAYANGSDYQLFADGAPLNCPKDPAPDSAALLCDVMIAANAKAATITLTAHLDGQAEDTESLAFEILAHANAPAYAPSTDANADINIVNTEFAFGFDDASARTSSENRLLELVMSPVGVTLTGGLAVNINTENTGGGLQATRGIDYQIIGCDAAACEFIIGGSDDNLILKVTLLLDSTDESAPEFFRLRIADGEGYAPSPPDFIDVEIADIKSVGFAKAQFPAFWGNAETFAITVRPAISSAFDLQFSISAIDEDGAPHSLAESLSPTSLCDFASGICTLPLSADVNQTEFSLTPLASLAGGKILLALQNKPDDYEFGLAESEILVNRPLINFDGASLQFTEAPAANTLLSAARRILNCRRLIPRNCESQS